MISNLTLTSRYAFFTFALVIFCNKITIASSGSEENEDLSPVFENSLSKQLCEEPPPPYNGDQHCGQHKKKKNRYVCKTECNEGFQFANGKKKMRYFCDTDTGHWTPELAALDCEPLCEPLCQNSGQCAEDNHCICTPEYRGSRCEYGLDLCNPTSGFHVSADWSCNHTSSESLCVMNCPYGTRYESSPADLYTCSQNGTWNPSYAPKCVPTNIIEPPSIPGISFNSLGQLSRVSHSDTCATWSGSHFRTFDGGLYNFWGSCTYLLTKDCSEGSFAIHLKNNTLCQIPSACRNSLIIYLGSKKHVLLYTPQGTVVEVDDQTHRIPTVVNGLLLQMLSDYVTVTSSIGFRLKWDQKNAVLIKLDDQLKNKTCGLCGRFDGTVLNDFETSDGTLTDSVEGFANSWIMNDLREICDDKAVVKDPCSKNYENQQKAENTCKAIFDKKFDACHYLLDPNAYFESCKMDHCECLEDENNCHCNSLSEYFKECIRLGGKIDGGWRNDTLCPLDCPPEMIYNDCGSSCPRTCKNTVYSCEDNHCVDGCHCPDGKFLHEEQCIEHHNCPCIHKGVEHQRGDRILQDCNACECNAGKWECTKKKCDARCSSTGDPHFTTFDGVQYEFLGTCPYYLVYNEEFTIVQETGPCSKLSTEEPRPEPETEDNFCTQSVKVTYNESILMMKTKSQIYLDDREIASLPLTENGIVAYMATSMFIKVDLPNDLSLLWDGHNRIYIDVPPTLEGKMKGLCGTFNRNQKDDFMTPEGDVEVDVSIFAERWKASDSCHKRSRRSGDWPCQSQPQKESDADILCSLIKSEIFRDCHDEVDPEPFYKGCVSDLCGCHQDLPECLCPALADYSSLCTRKGIVLSWINHIEACQPKCTGGQKYNECANPCTSSCSAISSNQMCIAHCVQGCSCPNGMTLNSEGFCIAIDQCSCVYEEKDYPPKSVSVQESSLCECENAVWRCRPATLEELVQHSDLMIDDAAIQCDATKHEEYTTCREECPKSCQNLHLPSDCKTKSCMPGCRCQKDYILDTKLAKCVKISQCGCRHGKQKYTDGQTVKKDCNVCTCKKGIWKCTENECPGTCTVWGDSHFKTFDGRIYDFQGTCEFLLTKGKTSSVSFKINMENVLCGTNRFSCTKSYTLEISHHIATRGGISSDTAVQSEKITLERDKSIPKINYSSIFIVYELGLYVFVHTDDGISLQWDKGTRLYLTLDPRWRNKVQGLCGNYNDDQQDDFLPPWGGAPETRPIFFADAWKIHEFCPTPVAITDTCNSHADRKAWAYKKCDILKSDIFLPCYSEVSLEPYYERCLIDTCSCDMGGDCECLCTAIAAYAKECNTHGVHIKWRSQELCPIQCEECATYESCISACPQKTCETQFLHKRIKETCSKDICVEGCLPKPCPDGQIYKDSKEYKCIPIVDCVVPCLKINGKMYNEGERVSEPGVTDQCQSCHCRRGSISCTGEPCPVTSISRIYNIAPPCVETGWTPWMNTPSVIGGDYELFENPLLFSMIGEHCGLDNVTGIECRVANTKIPHKETGQNVLCDLSRGLLCDDKDQINGFCEDYEIRLFCDCGAITKSSVCTYGWTEYYNVDHPTPDGMGDEESIENIRKHHDLCNGGTLQDVECKALVDNRLIDYTSTGQFGLKCSKSRGFICNNFLQPKGEICFDYVVRFYCSCEPTTPIPTTTTTPTTTRPSITPVEVACGWTPWLNVDKPEDRGDDEGDIEDIGLLQLVYNICGGKDLAAIECRIALTHHSYEESPQNNLFCDTENGFRCYNKDQIGSCYDYEVRVLCHYDWCPTTPPTSEAWKTTESLCPFGQVHDDCAYNCSQTCSAFAYQLSVITDKCKSSNWCIAGCRPAEGCQPPNLWRDHHNCVPKDQCTCVFPEGLGRTVSPHNVMISGCEKCQCLDDKLSCYPIPGCGVSTTSLPLKFETTTAAPVDITKDDCWTEWVNTDVPFKGAGDFESLVSIRRKYKFCPDPVEIECRSTFLANQDPLKNTKKNRKHQNETTNTLDEQTQQKICLRTGWTPWMNGHVLDDSGDTESLTNLRANHVFCSLDEIEAIECRSVVGWKYVGISSIKSGIKGAPKLVCDKKTGFSCKGPKCEDHELRVYCNCRSPSRKKREANAKQVMECNLRSGLACWNSDNIPEGCHDYEVRFFCPCPTTVPVITSTIVTMPPATCVHGWTDWYNSRFPDFQGDYETVQSVRSNGGYFCDNNMITAMECQPVDSPLGTPLQRGVICEPSVGLICRNHDLGGFETCSDYAVRFFCDCPTEAPEESITTETLPPPITPTRLPQLKGCAYWSNWINERHPNMQEQQPKKAVKGGGMLRGDFEKATLTRMQQETGFCLEGHLSNIECRVAETEEDYSETSQRNLVCSLVDGFRCRARDQFNGICRDYKIRYFCECEESTTTIILRPTGPTAHIPPCGEYYELVDGPDPLPDASLTASSSKDSYSGPQSARLSSTASLKSAGGWIAKNLNDYQYIEVDMGAIQPVYGVVIKGRDGAPEWVKSFKVLYSRNGMSYAYVSKGDKKNSDKVFSGNHDSFTPVRHIFEMPFEARYVRIQPITYHKEIALRMDILGCAKSQSTKAPFSTEGMSICRDEMGLSNGKISVKQILTSSNKNLHSGPDRLRLNTPQTATHSGGWIAKYLDEYQYVQIDLLEPRTITGIITQGRNGVPQYVTAFSISYSEDGIVWNKILDEYFEIKIFSGNHDSDTAETSFFPRPIRARIVRIHPLHWHNWISMRLELLGCFEPYATHATTEGVLSDTNVPTISQYFTGYCDEPMGFQSGELPDELIYVSSSYDKWSGVSRIRLNTPSDSSGTGGWVAATPDYKPEIYVDFLGERNITGIITQGYEDADKWIITYTVEYSLDHKTWNYAADSMTKNFAFAGNFDRHTPVVRFFTSMITARYLKITLLDYHILPALRMEILGCFKPYGEETPTTPEYCVEYGPWLSLTDPASSYMGDEEPIDKIIAYSGICSNPIGIQCREMLTRQDYTKMAQSLSCDLRQGLLCKSVEQTNGHCYNYEVRIKCWSCGVSSTPAPFSLVTCPEVPESLVFNCPSSCEYGHQACDGSKCVSDVDCPCFIGETRFNPGDVLVTEQCERCECSIEGHSKCKPILCNANQCEEGQTAKLNKYCECECVGCPIGTVLCPTSDQCIKEDQWCDGIVDCPDDEMNCPTTLPPTTAVPTITELPISCFDNITDTCYMIANMFHTFDGLSYQYDVCDHVLMKNKDFKDLFSVSVHKMCASNDPTWCRKHLVIKVDDLSIEIGPELDRDLSVNGMNVSLSNLWLLSRRYQEFQITKEGNHLVFVSFKYHFEVAWDAFQDAVITVSRCVGGHIAGLCGFYNKKTEDDRMMPNGTLAAKNSDFGDSWSTKPYNRCVAPDCSLPKMTKAVEVCNKLAEPPFDECSQYLDQYARIDACTSHMCDCLQQSLEPRLSRDKHAFIDLELCKCAVYESFVEACETAKNSSISEWRIKYDCTPNCPPGMEWQDCGPGCDLTCDNYRHRAEICSKSCIPGCYCPQGLLHHHNRCVKPKMCQDCICRGHGDPNYITFDGKYYAFQGNCTYVLAQHQTSNELLNFKVLAKNYECPEEPGTSCVEGLEVIWNGRLVQKYFNQPVFLDGVALKDEASSLQHNGISISYVPGKSTLIHVQEINLVVRYFDQMYGFNVELPAHIYFNATEGLCGICNFDESDDLYHRGGYITEDIEDFAYSWLREGYMRSMCTFPREILPSPPPFICNFTENSCEIFIDPNLYIKSCNNDVTYSRNPDASVCRSKFQYAQQCCERGVSLVDWLHQSDCELPCPDGMTFECASACPITCDNFKTYQVDDCDLMDAYTCTCPPGQVLKFGYCVDVIMCQVCDAKGHVIGDTWFADPCKKCECMSDLSVECTVTKCPEPPICKIHETLVTLTPHPNVENPDCCAVYQCRTVERKECPSVPEPECEPGEAKVLDFVEDCPRYSCECKSLLCPSPVKPTAPREDGEQFILEKIGCCQQYVSKCFTETCGNPEECKPGFKLSTQEGKCCSKFSCVPKENVCVFQHKNFVENNISVSLSSDEYYEVEYENGSSWQDGPCNLCSCFVSEKIFMEQKIQVNDAEVTCVNEICSSASEFSDGDKYVLHEEHLSGVCCPKYTRVKCKSNGNIYSVGESWPSPDQDRCTTFHCEQENGAHVILKERTDICHKSCPEFAVYEESPLNSSECCGQCKIVACEENGIIYQPGETWPSKLKACYNAQCELIDDNVVVLYQRICPEAPENCPEENLVTYRNGCCSYCKAEESCNPVTLPEAATIGFFQLTIQDKGSCYNSQPLKNLTKCIGLCGSTSSYSTLMDTFESSCKCCLPQSSQIRLISMDCEDGSKVQKVYHQPTTCQCSSCSEGTEKETIELPTPV